MNSSELPPAGDEVGSAGAAGPKPDGKLPVIVVVPAGGVVPPLEAVLEEAEPIVVRTAQELHDAQERADVLFLNDFRSTLLREVGPGGLRWIHTSSIGMDPLLTEAVLDSDIVATNSRGVCERPIAEWVLGVITMHVKDLRRTIELQLEHRWMHRETRPLSGRRALVVGPGPIGREVTRLLRAVGLEVTLVGRSARLDPELGEVRAIAELDDLLGDFDDVVLTLPLTQDTRGLFDVGRLRRMRQGAHLVNISRGAVVVGQDLLDAIDDGHLGAASLDAFEQEPLSPDSPFWSRSNILVSPHASGDLVGWRGRVVDCFVENLRRWKAGQPLRDVVDLRALGVTEPASTEH